MENIARCPDCGCELRETVLGGLCPQCLLKGALNRPPLDHPPLTKSMPKSTFPRFVPPAPAEIAELIPQVEILELVGQGGMGAVYKGRQRSLDRFVAVKVLPPDIGRDHGFAERFTREARALGRLNHPNIVAVHDSGNAQGLYYFVMEFVDGLNLRQLLQDKRLPAKDSLAIVQQVCDALQFAHDEGVVHRDIKPENILIDHKGRVKIADFGLAKLLSDDAGTDNLTGSHQVMGTPKYMAPEQLEGAKAVDHRADIYSLGVVFYELLTGELPLGRFQPPSARVPLDVRLDNIVLRTLEQNPEARYQQAGEVKTEVETVVGAAGHTPSQSSMSAKPSPAAAKTAPSWFGRQINRFATDFDEIERPFVRFVALPLVAFVGFYIVNAASRHVTKSPPHGISDLVVFGCLWTFVVFVFLNLLWIGVWWANRGRTVPPQKLEPAEIDAQIQRSSFWLRVAGLFSFCGWIVPVPVPEFDGFAWKMAWGILAGCILCMAARSLGKKRQPGLFPLLVAMVPLSPAVMLGLPVSLQILRFLARPEVSAHLESQAREAAAQNR